MSCLFDGDEGLICCLPLLYFHLLIQILSYVNCIFVQNQQFFCVTTKSRYLWYIFFIIITSSVMIFIIGNNSPQSHIFPPSLFFNQVVGKNQEDEEGNKKKVSILNIVSFVAIIITISYLILPIPTQKNRMGDGWPTFMYCFTYLAFWMQASCNHIYKNVTIVEFL